MLTEVMQFYGLLRPPVDAGFFETEHAACGSAGPAAVWSYDRPARRTWSAISDTALPTWRLRSHHVGRWPSGLSRTGRRAQADRSGRPPGRAGGDVLQSAWRRGAAHQGGQEREHLDAPTAALRPLTPVRC
jgi:hypothetical protein